MRVFGTAVMAAGLLLLGGGACARRGDTGSAADSAQRQPPDLGPTGRNDFYILEPGYQLVLERGRERLEVTVLPDTVLVDSVWTRVVEERETDRGALKEVSRNFMAISRSSGNVYYFGEDVDVYERGVVAAHEGAWRSGVNGGRYGLMMPARPAVGASYQQEEAPGVAMDRARIAALDDTLTTPAGRFTGVLRIEETTPLEPGAHESKWYARGVGLIRDADLVLVRRGPAPANR